MRLYEAFTGDSVAAQPPTSSATPNLLVLLPPLGQNGRLWLGVPYRFCDLRRRRWWIASAGGVHLPTSRRHQPALPVTASRAALGGSGLHRCLRWPMVALPSFLGLGLGGEAACGGGARGRCGHHAAIPVATNLLIWPSRSVQRWKRNCARQAFGCVKWPWQAPDDWLLRVSIRAGSQ